MNEGVINDPSDIDYFLKKLNIKRSGGKLLLGAINAGDEKIFDYLIKKGADINLPPDSLDDDPEYRNTPFSISAAAAGRWSMFMKVIEQGGPKDS